jgi:hypothetical protein
VIATGRQLLARKLTLLVAVVGALAYFAWRTGLYAATQGGPAWDPGFHDLFLAVLLGLMVRQAFHILG